MSDIELSLVATECKRAAEDCDGDLEAKIKSSMKIAAHHWMVTDEDKQFRGALAGVMLFYGEGSPEFARIKTEVDGLRKISAIISAAQAGLSVNLSETELPPDDHKPLGLMKMWQDTLKEAA